VHVQNVLINLVGLKKIFIWWSITLQEQNCYLYKKTVGPSFFINFTPKYIRNRRHSKTYLYLWLPYFMCSHKNNYSIRSEEIISITVVSSCFSWSMIKKIAFLRTISQTCIATSYEDKWTFRMFNLATFASSFRKFGYLKHLHSARWPVQPFSWNNPYLRSYSVTSSPLILLLGHNQKCVCCIINNFLSVMVIFMAEIFCGKRFTPKHCSEHKLCYFLVSQTKCIRSEEPQKAWTNFFCN